MSLMTRKNNGAAPAPTAVQVAVREALERDGERVVCEALGLSRLSVNKLAFGRPCYPGTIALAQQRLGIADA
jgi:hypothetical protein